MNKFFVPAEIYKDRIDICKKCIYYFKPTGSCKVCKCFMKIKARIAPMACPQKYWDKTTETEMPNDLPQDMIDEVINLWPDLKTGRAKNQAAKGKMIEIYNTIHNTNYSTHTNCGSCISTCFDGIKKIYKKYTDL
tara:strand:+ start:678 stop:1082 length:405 start_codon:yes stop_codon:yes gene_type:complete